MARLARHAQGVPNSLVKIFDAAWLVVGRRAYSLPLEEEAQLRLDVALRIGQLVASGVTDARELLRRTFLHFAH
jgi:hypothetical protein